MFNNAADLGVDANLSTIMAEAGFPFLTGMRESLVALGHWTNYSTRKDSASDTNADITAGRDALLAARGDAVRCLEDCRYSPRQDARSSPLSRTLSLPRQRSAIPSPSRGVHLPWPQGRLGPRRLGLTDEAAVRVAFADVVASMKSAALSIPPASILSKRWRRGASNLSSGPQLSIVSVRLSSRVRRKRSSSVPGRQRPPRAPR